MGVEAESNRAAGFVPLFQTDADDTPREPLELAEGKPVETTTGTDFFVSGIEGMKKRAFDEGFAAGERKTLSQMSQQLQDQIARWQQSMAELSANVELELDSFMRSMEERTVAMAVQIAKKIVQREIKADPQSIRRRLEAALFAHKSKPVVSVRVHPNDHVFLKQLVTPHMPADAGSGMEGLPASLSDASLVEDPSVEPGGFILETDTATYDHTIRSQLLKIEKDLARLYESPGD